MKLLLFAYGTLVTGTPDKRINALVQRNLIPVCNGSIRARRYELGAYPGAVASAAPADRLEGILFAVKDPRRTLRVLDRYEGYVSGSRHGSEFVRRRGTVICAGTHRRVRAWVYYYNGNVGGKRPSMASSGPRSRARP